MTAIFEQVLWMRLLKVATSDLMTRNLRRNGKDRHAIPMAIEEAIDEVKIARAATACAHGNLSCNMSIRSCGERGNLFMSYMKPLDLLASSNDVG
jgi:hypothetical protein